MPETYADRLERVAGSLPPDPCILALVPTVTADHAAGLASDFARVVARRRDGHTLLFSLEDAPSRLDHEIGVEEGTGLTDVIEGRVSLARAAASGRSRGFIYVPAGRDPTSGVHLVRSSAWRSLAASAVGRGGTVLAFMPREVLEAARGAADEPTARLDGVVWLGPEPADVVWLPWRAFGALDLPDGAEADAAAAWAVSPAAARAGSGPASRGGDESPADGAPGSPASEVYGGEPSSRPPGQRTGGESGDARTDAPIVVRGASRRARRERERRRRRLLVTAMIVAFVAALTLAALALIGPDRREAFLPQNDSLWSSPDSTATAPADTPPARPDTSGA